MITLLRLATTAAAGAAALVCIAAAPQDAVPVNAAHLNAAHVNAAHVNAAHVNAADSSGTVAASSAGSPAFAWEHDGDDYPCPFVAAPGYLEGGGGNSQVIQDDGHNYMGCGDGPNISLDHVDGDTVTFSLHGDRVRIREGATERLGPYRVHVVDIRGRRVELELSDPD